MDFDWSPLAALVGDGVEVWRVAAAAAVLAAAALAAAALLRGPVARLLVWPFRAAPARLWSTSRAEIAEVVRPSLGLLVVAAGLYAAGQILAVGDGTEAALHRLVRTLAVLALSWALSRAVRMAGAKDTPLSKRLGGEVVDWGARLVGILVWLVGVAAVLELWGVRVAPLLASLGILGVGEEVWRVAAAAAVLAASVLLRKPVAGLLIRPFLAAPARLWSTPRAEIAEVVRPPLGLLVVAAGLYAAGQILAVGDGTEAALHRLMRTLAVLALSWALSRAVRMAGAKDTALSERLGGEVARWGARLVGILVWLVGVAAVLELWGVRVAPLLASLGILGVAVALGAQDFFKNLISGFVVLSEKRYRIGDRIQLAGVVDGSVEEVGFRSTRVQLFDGAPVLVPNAMLADGALVNYGKISHRRILMNIGLEYRTRSDQLRRIRDEIKAYLQDSGDFVVAKDTTLEVRVDRFSDSSIDLLVYCFANTPDWSKWLETKERLILRIKQIVEEAGSGFAFPSRSVYVETDGAAGPAS